MMRTLVIAMFAMVAMASVPPAHAQRKYRLEMKPQRPPGTNYGRHYEDVDYPSPEKRAANLAELLNLTEEQKQKTQAIFLDQDKQSFGLWADESLSASARDKKIAELRESTTKKIRDLLSDEQRKKYDALAVPIATNTPDKKPPNEP